MTTISEALRERIVAATKQPGIRQADIAYQSNVSPSVISRFVRGTTSIDIASADKIDTALKKIERKKQRTANDKTTDGEA